ncbi:NAD-dependent succinate-semialdehyde dehydrogenase [Parendozoicomonas haliclonae]|uniref:Glutarate-semialdehyde dehydrogenase DavD n=1 Tax=Parendozoicomonas haliclonae TaxID=1960125 RepID=A0A1X7AGU1_9GAMM|nr:NAD-dependent succinate-semialdehyde dehydrogenase [Parendozoicomonas haliclonae]SMA41404.1 Glutarate-semialdehyde dehydrogenase DavD [Parendozoicomonas haliclonae]
MKSIVNQALLACLCKPSDSAIEVTNPATGEVLGSIPVQSRQEIDDALERSRQAQKEWQKTTAKERAVILKRWYDLLMANQDDLGRIMTMEQGKPLAEAKGEVAYGASFIEWFAEEGKRTYGDTIPGHTGDRRLMTIKQPVGVAAAITPWNFPIAMITRKAAPALAAGCSFVGKPAHQTPLSAYAVAELAYQAGVPRDVFQLVMHKSPQEVGDAFCKSEAVRKLSFTGSTRVGRILTAQCADTVKRVSMELGGNAPFVVFDDADLDAAVAGAIASKFRNAGQTCVCANRLYVHDAIYDQFMDKFIAAVGRLRMGNGLDEGVNVGPVIDQVAKHKILGLVDHAVSQGAKIAAGGTLQDGLFVEPTVLTDVEQSMDIVQEEIFGPVAPVIRFSSDEELITKANDTIYGLAAYFYSRDINRIWKVAESLEYGMVGINEGIISTEVAPFGGVKQSGFGREGAKEGIDEYLEVKYLCFGGIQG